MFNSYNYCVIRYVVRLTVTSCQVILNCFDPVSMQLVISAYEESRVRMNVLGLVLLAICNKSYIMPEGPLAAKRTTYGSLARSGGPSMTANFTVDAPGVPLTA